MTERTKAKISAPSVAPRADGEHGWQLRDREDKAWLAIPAYASFVNTMAKAIETAAIAMVRDGNEIPGVSVNEYTYSMVDVENADGTWSQQRTRKKRAGKPTRSYVAVLRHVKSILANETYRTVSTPAPASE